MLLDMTRTVLNKLRYYSDIHQRDVRKPGKNFSGRNLKPNPPKYETHVLHVKYRNDNRLYE